MRYGRTLDLGPEVTHKEYLTEMHAAYYTTPASPHGTGLFHSDFRRGIVTSTEIHLQMLGSTFKSSDYGLELLLCFLCT